MFPLWDVSRDQPIPHSAVLLVGLYMYACCIAGERGMLFIERLRESYGRLSCRSTVHLFAPLKVLDNRVRKYKRCSFSCGMEKYSTDECCIFQYRTQMSTVCISYHCYTHSNNFASHPEPKLLPTVTITLTLHFSLISQSILNRFSWNFAMTILRPPANTMKITFKNILYCESSTFWHVVNCDVHQ